MLLFIIIYYYYYFIVQQCNDHLYASLDHVVFTELQGSNLRRMVLYEESTHPMSQGYKTDGEYDVPIPHENVLITIDGRTALPKGGKLTFTSGTN